MAPDSCVATSVLCVSCNSASRRLSARLCLSPAHAPPLHWKPVIATGHTGWRWLPAIVAAIDCHRRHRDRNHNQDHDIELGHPGFLRGNTLSFQQCTGSSTAPSSSRFPFRSAQSALAPRVTESLCRRSGPKYRVNGPGIFQDNRCIKSNGAPVDAPHRSRYSRNTGFGTSTPTRGPARQPRRWTWVLPRALRLPSKSAVCLHSCRRVAAVRFAFLGGRHSRPFTIRR